MLVENDDEHVCKLCAFLPSSEPSSPKWKDEEKQDYVNTHEEALCKWYTHEGENNRNNIYEVSYSHDYLPKKGRVMADK